MHLEQSQASRPFRTQALAAPERAPSYLNHPGLRAFAAAMEACSGRGLTDEERDERSEAAVELAEREVFDVPARTLDDVLAKLASYLVSYGMGGRSVADANLFHDLAADPDASPGLDGGEVLAGIALDLQRLVGQRN